MKKPAFFITASFSEHLCMLPPYAVAARGLLQ